MLPSKGGWQIPIVPANKEEFKISHVQDRMTLPKQQQQKTLRPTRPSMLHYYYYEHTF